VSEIDCAVSSALFGSSYDVDPISPAVRPTRGASYHRCNSRKLSWSSKFQQDRGSPVPARLPSVADDMNKVRLPLQQLAEREAIFRNSTRRPTLAIGWFSTRCFLCFLDQVFKHQCSQLMFDDDCRGKFDFLSEPMRLHLHTPLPACAPLPVAVCSKLTIFPKGLHVFERRMSSSTGSETDSSPNWLPRLALLFLD
jgi:hypothetical protein